MFFGSTAACNAASPTRTFPSLSYATMDGVVYVPSKTILIVKFRDILKFRHCYFII